METMRFFKQPRIGASVFLADQEGVVGNDADYLPIDQNGLIQVPEGIKPKGFHLLLAMPRHNNRYIVVQKNVAKEKGAYHTHFLSEVAEDGCVGYLMADPIEVMRAGQNVWTSWHKERPNRVDCFYLAPDGSFRLYQIGVVTHDDGKTWLLHGEYRWRGRLFRSDNGLVAKPEEPKWGSFAKRDDIFSHPGFVQLSEGVNFAKWRGTPKDLEPDLGPIPSGNAARVQWYVSFGGQTGQGIAIRRDGSSAWIHGIDIQQEPDPDGVKRLWTGDLINFSEAVSFGTQKNRPPKLLNVRKVG